MYDAIIVGARCAGAPTAMLLARKGYRVLLVDKATFPSDVISTHIVWPHGAALLDRWGLLEPLAATGCPPIALDLTFDVGPFALRGGVVDTNDGRGGFCPRRTVLDDLLVQAAVAAGAELRDAFTVTSLLRDGDRVVGIRGHGRTGGHVEERGRIVVGADGVHSVVAKEVQAVEYDIAPPLTANYYGYFRGFDAADIEMYVRDLRAIGCFPTHDGLTLIAVMWPTEMFEAIRADIDGHFAKALELTPRVADRVARARREERWAGIAGVRNYFRQPFGPGWTLIGDAGYQKDPITAQGISDAFIDADALATTLDRAWSRGEALEPLLTAQQAARDRRVKPLHDFTLHLATLQPPPPDMQALFAALRDNRADTNRFFSAITGSSPLPEFMRTANLERIMSGATPGAGR